MKSLGAESFLYVTTVLVLVFSRLTLVLPTSWDDVGPRMGRLRWRDTGVRPILGPASSQDVGNTKVRREKTNTGTVVT